MNVLNCWSYRILSIQKKAIKKPYQLKFNFNELKK